MNCTCCGHKLSAGEAISQQALRLMERHNLKAKYAVIGQSTYAELAKSVGFDPTKMATPVGEVTLVVLPSPYEAETIRVVPEPAKARYMKGPI